MNEEREEEQHFNRIRGEYIGLMASLEFNLTLLLAEWLDMESHRQEFQHWFVEAPIPFRSKVLLYEAMTSDDIQLAQFGDLPQQMRVAYDFRNTLAHSFRQFKSVVTSRGIEVPTERISLEALDARLWELAQLDNLILNLLVSAIEGPPERAFTDDYADWPYGGFYP